MCKSIPLEAPWEAKNAEKWDQITLAKWLSSNTFQARTRLLETALAGCYTSAASEVSMLFVLYQMASGGGPGFLLGVKDGAQDSRLGRRHGRDLSADGRRDRRLAAPVAAGPSHRLRCRRRDGALRRHDRAGAAGNRCGAAWRSPARSSTSPCLPVDRSFLHQRMPSGAIFKINIVYDEPFWRNDGLSGQSAAPGSPATVTIDASTDAPRPGVLCVIVEGPIARQIGRLDDTERRRRSWPNSSDASGTRPLPCRLSGAELDHRAVLRRRNAQPCPDRRAHRVRPCVAEPCGRIHWAGTESSAVMCGWVDGAVRSGERAAAEVMQRERVGVA